MTKRLDVTPAPGPLEDFALEFDGLFSRRNQREAFRRYLEGLLLPAERNKTLTALANAEPLAGAQQAQVQRLQWFLSESNWDAAAVGQLRRELLQRLEMLAPTAAGVLAIDETGDRKWGNSTAHVGRQYLGSIGKVDNGVVSVHALWADERLYYPLEVEPYTPAHWFARGNKDAGFRTKPALALELVERAHKAGVPFKAVVADSLYGKHDKFIGGLHKLGVGYVVAMPPSFSWWHPKGEPGSITELVAGYPWQPDALGKWRQVVREFRDGHREPRWVLEVVGRMYGPQRAQRLVVVTTDPVQLPEQTTWYLATNLPSPRTLRAQESSLPAANLAEVTRLYGLRAWVEQSYKQVKQSLGWAQYQVRADHAIRRHWELVCCAFAFCWWALARGEVETVELDETQQPARRKSKRRTTSSSRRDWGATGKKNTAVETTASQRQLAGGAARSARLAGAMDHVATLLAGVVGPAPTACVPGAA